MMRRASRLDVAVFVGILLLGLGRLPAPFTGDQALNMLMGEVIADGGAPYVDLWDLKHPGIFLHFAAGGSLFGFNEIGIHLFELLWMLALALAVRVTAGHFLESRVAISLAPAFTVGFYYAVATSLHLTQAEVLVGLPLLLSLASAAAAVRRGARHRLAWLLASGLCAGVVFVFKAPYVALPVIFWVLSSVEVRRASNRRLISEMLRLAWPLFVGALLPVSATIIYLASQDALGVAWWTFTVHPGEAASQVPIEPRRLLDSFIWFLRTFSAPLALAFIGAWDRVRRGWDLLTAALIAWIGVGLPLIWFQVIGWWQYHYLLLLVPLGLLAMQGVATLIAIITPSEASRYRRAAAAAALLVLMAVSLPRIEPGLRAIVDVVRARPLPFDSVSARTYQSEIDQAYAESQATTSFLRSPQSHPGPIYVFGSPIIYVHAGRSPAISPLATWFHPTREAWHRMMREMTAAMPAYILVAEGALESVTVDNPSLVGDMRALRAWLDQQYETLRSDVGGTWYLRRDLAASVAPG
jgi:hypothetical protein